MHNDDQIEIELHEITYDITTTEIKKIAVSAKSSY